MADRQSARSSAALDPSGSVLKSLYSLAALRGFCLLKERHDGAP